MLLNLQVRNFAIVDEIDVDFEPGLSVLTGETGAGKSILVDALGLILGERGGSGLVREGARRAEFSAEFDLTALPEAIAWLEEQSLDLDSECVLRRVIGADGRSRAYINGNAVPLQNLKAIGEFLADIHGQHFHQSLGRRDVQRDLLDHFGELTELRAEVEAAFVEWQQVDAALRELREAAAERESRLDLLEFQVNELDALNADGDEIEALTAERRKLQNADRLAAGLTAALDALYDGDGDTVQSLVSAAVQELHGLADFDDDLAPIVSLLEEASIQVNEAADGLRRYGDGLDADPARREWVEDRLHGIRDVARKHRVEPEDLGEVQTRLRDELESLRNAAERGDALERDAGEKRRVYLERAAALSSARAETAVRLAAEVTAAMSGLGMPEGRFDVTVEPRDHSLARRDGLDSIEYRISANPGSPLMPLSRVASGGELSRMSLAIQVVASGGSRIPTMVFDEVDSGVGGGVAEMVGRRLRDLGSRRQVLCVTHLPQVASQADHHLRIHKLTDGKTTRTRVTPLGEDERVEELARMLGGVDITQRTRDHAAEMLATGRRNATQRSRAGSS
ncbi:MAG: DNA repair protein RecN [Woeseiaceae bacterium]|nr:DNA repair protein RecN [Woeseiaceae bacterium]